MDTPTPFAAAYQVCYRPQRSCGKVMFLHVSVILFTGGGVWQADTPLAGRHPLPGQSPPWADTPHRQAPPGMATAVDGVHPTGMHSCY